MNQTLVLLFLCTILSYTVQIQYTNCLSPIDSLIITRDTGNLGVVSPVERKEDAIARVASFSHIFQNHVWGKESQKESENAILRRSGPGSTIPAARSAIDVVVRIARELYAVNMRTKARSRRGRFLTIVDVPCGDLTWMNESLIILQNTGIPLVYFGFDIVPAIVEQNRRLFAHHKNWRFGTLDLVESPPPIPRSNSDIDLFVTRQMTQHLYTRDALAALHNIKKSGAQFLLATTFPKQGGNQELTPQMYRYRRQNLEAPPFSLPTPLCLVPDCCDENAIFLACWNLSLWYPET